MTLKQNKLYNTENGSSSFYQPIVGGNPSGILAINLGQYGQKKWWKDLYRKMGADFWLPERFDLTADAKQYHTLIPGFKEAYIDILDSLIFLDSIQTINPMEFTKYITAVDINFLIAFQTFQEAIHCYKEGTEVLTSVGWKNFKDVTYDDKIANYNEDGVIDFTPPTDIISSYYTGDMYDFIGQRYNVSVTPNHRMVKLDAYNDDKVKIEYADTVSVHNHKLPVSGKLKDNGKEMSPYDRLRVAYQADGILKNSHTVNRSNSFMYLFKFKKDRKIQRFLDILETGEFRYTMSTYDDGYTGFHVWTDSKMEKDFSWVDLSEIGYTYARQFIKELWYWDGTHKRTKRYINTDKSCIDMVTAIASICGYRTSLSISPKGVKREPIRDSGKPVVTTKDCYVVTFTDRSYVSGRAVSKQITHYEGNIYCVTVPSSMILVRYEGKISVSGNSQSYSYINETVVPSSEEREAMYDRWRTNDILNERNKHLTNIYERLRENPTAETFMDAIIANYILEGLYFYNGFKFFYALEEKGLMKGTADIITLINRDEISHLILYENIILEIMDVKPEWVNFDKIGQMFIDAVEFEEAFSLQSLSDCFGFNEEIITGYTRFLANKRMSKIGFVNNPYSEYNTNPYKHFDDATGDEALTSDDSEDIAIEENTFTSGVSTYVKADNLSGWDELE